MSRPCGPSPLGRGTSPAVRCRSPACRTRWSEAFRRFPPGNRQMPEGNTSPPEARRRRTGGSVSPPGMDEGRPEMGGWRREMDRRREAMIKPPRIVAITLSEAGERLEGTVKPRQRMLMALEAMGGGTSGARGSGGRGRGAGGAGACRAIDHRRPIDRRRSGGFRVDDRCGSRIRRRLNRTLLAFPLPIHPAQHDAQPTNSTAVAAAEIGAAPYSVYLANAGARRTCRVIARQGKACTIDLANCSCRVVADTHTGTPWGWSPSVQDGQQVVHVDDAVAERLRSNIRQARYGRRWARSPGIDDREKIVHVDHCIGSGDIRRRCAAVKDNRGNVLTAA